MKNKKKTKLNVELDSEKLLDEILAKRRAKQQRVVLLKKKVNTSTPKRSLKKDTLSNYEENDLIYEQILAKRELKKNNKSNKVVNVNKIVVNNIKEEKTKKNKYTKFINIFISVLSCLLVFIILYILLNFSYLKKPTKEEKVSFEYVKPYYIRKDPEYISCMNERMQQDIIQNEMYSYIEELNTYLDENYNASVLYYDLTNNFKYTYNENNVYYAASVAKMVVALYIYKNASDGLIDMNDTIVFQRKYKNQYSVISTKYNYGAHITIRELVSASILTSDNSAHSMLVDYIGKNKIIAFGRSLGASYTLDTDDYGHININDAYCYLNALNEYLNSSDELSLEFKKLLLQADENNLNLSDFNVYAAQKYGHYASFYHNIGVMYDKHPYLIAILSLEGAKEDLELRINDISQEIYQLHLNYYAAKENYCLNQVQKK